MAYTPTVWVTGDVITAVKLNKAENGIAANSVLTVMVTKEDNAYVADKEFADACAAVEAGQDVRLIYVQAGVGPLPEMRYIYDLKKYMIASESIVGLCFISADLNGGGVLAVTGLQWSADGISTWPDQ